MLDKDELMSGAAHPLAGHPGSTAETVSIEVIPIGATVEKCDGAVLRLSVMRGGEEIDLKAGVSGPQCRRVAFELLRVADAASGGADRTLLVTTEAAMWRIPGQALIVRLTPAGFQMDFAAKPGENLGLILPDKKLVVP